MDTTLKKISLSISEDINNFEKCLEEIISNQDIFLKEDLSSFIFKNPKRLRPIFTFLFARYLEIENEKVINIALAQELIHSASLIHDDILDEEIERRGQQTFHSKYNTKTSVILGDLLLSLALEVLSKTNISILQIFSEKIKKTILGELKQNEKVFKEIKLDEYYNKTFEKTGNLFLAGLESLFKLKDVSQETKNSFINFLVNFATAFQIKNDLKDFKTKNSSDIKNGNYTLPMLYFLMENELKNYNQSFDFEKYIKLTEEKINEYHTKAIQSLKNIKTNTYIETIIELSKYALGS